MGRSNSRDNRSKRDKKSSHGRKEKRQDSHEHTDRRTKHKRDNESSNLSFIEENYT